jgi:hypothetical protein
MECNWSAIGVLEVSHCRELNNFTNISRAQIATPFFTFSDSASGQSELPNFVPGVTTLPMPNFVSPAIYLNRLHCSCNFLDPCIMKLSTALKIIDSITLNIRYRTLCVFNHHLLR